jgi:hypothetical protein
MYSGKIAVPPGGGGIVDISNLLFITNKSMPKPVKIAISAPLVAKKSLRLPFM